MQQRINATDEVATICRNLLRIDTSNYGDGSGPGERVAAEYCAELLTEVGLDVELFESAPGRTSVVTRLEGSNPDRPALVVHGHTDVVPAIASDWLIDPFAGEERDGLLWGRGAVDMKNMDAMILAVVRQYVRQGRKPKRDLIIAMFADEEAGSLYGAHWAVANRPELFAGATEAISEVGGFSTEVAGRRAYLVQTAEKGISWLRLIANGRAGHGSAVNPDNAVTALAAAVARIGRFEWPYQLTPTVTALLQGVADLTGLPFDADEARAPSRARSSLAEGKEGVDERSEEHAGCAVDSADSAAVVDPNSAALREQIDALVAALGPAAPFVGATVRHTANATCLEAGYKANVVPGTAAATVDCRWLPGFESQGREQLVALAGDAVRVEPIHEDISLEVPFDGSLVDSMVDALLAEDPGAAVLPYTLSGGTDNKALARLGITGYGFAPLQLPSDLDFVSMFHGVDERVPIAGLQFGTRVLDRLFASC